MKKLNVVFLGTPDFAVPSLDMLCNHPDVNIQCVVSMPDRPAGRGASMHSPEVISFAKSKKIKIVQTENINKSDEFLKATEEADLFIVLAFAQFLNDKVLNIPKLGCFNIHTSLLPKYRGAAPIQYALLNGDTQTGVSIQRMVKKMDAGDIAHSSGVDISPNETGGQLYTRLKFQAALSLNEFIYKLLGDDIQFTTQDETAISFAPTLKREDGRLDFINEDFVTLNNKVRALYPWPGTYCMQGKKRIKVFKIEKSDITVASGQTLLKDKMILIGAKDCTIRIVELQLEGKKRCHDFELINGLREDFKID